jgi:predicted RNase H-like HicB family nuclease
VLHHLDCAQRAGLLELVVRYPIAIEIDAETAAYGVVVADLPGCFSAADTLDEAVTAAEEAVAAWIDATLDAGGAIPPPSSIEAVRAPPEYAGWAFGVVPVDPTALDSTVERVNITLPRWILLQLDAQARAAGESRSEYIAHPTLRGGGDRWRRQYATAGATA